ncbi:F1/F0 ATPase, subunit 2 [Azotobacter beijerinckii]|uniref:F1/F0 ATPase, subunit 2 n=1 Tax=Azotobacter beijerinckii TaxID=170623 RepID=A0A1H9P3B9_9GAMM|nr:ATP synthase subunit I [Azotobacter beijerinckii]SER42678.1 F1/F0 ATPase, subunit 2 [Azotobacter beijerinckii]
MTGWPLLPLAAQLGAGLLVGLLVGALHFASLALNLRLFCAGRVLPALALQLLRVGLSVAVLAALIRVGLAALLAGAAGLLLARQRVLRRERP